MHSLLQGQHRSDLMFAQIKESVHKSNFRIQTRITSSIQNACKALLAFDQKGFKSSASYRPSHRALRNKVYKQPVANSGLRTYLGPAWSAVGRGSRFVRGHKLLVSSSLLLLGGHNIFRATKTNSQATVREEAEHRALLTLKDLF
jgi:hypothetical protein